MDWLPLHGSPHKVIKTALFRTGHMHELHESGDSTVQADLFRDVGPCGSWCRAAATCQKWRLRSKNRSYKLSESLARRCLRFWGVVGEESALRKYIKIPLRLQMTALYLCPVLNLRLWMAPSKSHDLIPDNQAFLELFICGSACAYSIWRRLLKETSLVEDGLQFTKPMQDQPWHAHAQGAAKRIAAQTCTVHL